MPDSYNYDLTTKNTKATKVSDTDIFRLLNFVLFVTFVVKVIFLSLSTAEPRRAPPTLIWPVLCVMRWLASDS